MVRRRRSASRRHNYQKILVGGVLGLAAVAVAFTPIDHNPQPEEEKRTSHTPDSLPEYNFFVGAAGKPAKPSDLPDLNMSAERLSLNRTAPSFERVASSLHHPTFLADLSNLLAGPVSTWSILKAIWRLDSRDKFNSLLLGDGLAFTPTNPSPLTSRSLTASRPLLPGLDILSFGLALKVSASCALCHMPEPTTLVEPSLNSDLSLGLLRVVAGTPSALFAPLYRAPSEAASMASNYGAPRASAKPAVLGKPSNQPLLTWPSQVMGPPW